MYAFIKQHQAVLNIWRSQNKLKRHALYTTNDTQINYVGDVQSGLSSHTVSLAADADMNSAKSMRGKMVSSNPLSKQRL